MLTFDSWQRCETVRNLVAWCFPDPGARILDVGGYPGRMRSMMPEHSWVLCDPRVDSPGDQLKGNAKALPFQDEAFDFALSMDVLEHVSEKERYIMLDEMCRVAQYGIILTFPHRHELVEQAENSVRKAYHSIHRKDHPWLSEHSAHPLPDTDKIVTHLANKGVELATFDVGSISHWVYLQLVDMLLETLPDSYDLVQELDHFYQEKLFIHDFNPPTYRKIVFALFHAAEPISLELLTSTREEETAVEIELQRKVMHGLLEGLKVQRENYQRLQEKNVVKSTESEAYLNRLEDSMQNWEQVYLETVKTLNDSLAWRDRLEQRFSFRLYKFTMRLLGKRVE